MGSETGTPAVAGHSGADPDVTGSSITIPEGTPAAHRRVFVAQIMGTVISVHVHGPEARGTRTADAVAAVVADLQAAEARFSPFRADSELCQLQRGELDLVNASDQMREVERLCRTALERTNGWFDAWHSRTDGLFDPTGLTKSWAVARAARHLDALGAGYAISAGGDVLVRASEGHEPWMIGVEDPRDTSTALARVPVHDGAVATSGVAARGAHILRPDTGEAATEVLSATVVGPSLLWSDVMATAAVARGASAVDWVPTLHGTSGVLVLADDTVFRWTSQV